MPSRSNFFVAYLHRAHQRPHPFLTSRKETRRNENRREDSLLEALIERTQDAGGDIIQAYARKAVQAREMLLHLRVQQIVQLRGELDARRAAACELRAGAWTCAQCEVVREGGSGTRLL